MKNILKTLAPAALLLASCSLGFAGIAANGSFGFNSTGGTVSFTGSGGIDTATMVTLPVPSVGVGVCGVGGFVCEQITSINPTYLGNPNDFFTGGTTPLAINDDVTFNSYTFDLSFATLPTFFFTNQNGNRFKFVADTATKTGLDLGGGSAFLNVGYVGIFSDTGGTYDSSPAVLSLTFNQTGGPTGAITYAGTFATPPTPGTVPEPATMTLMGGALVAIGAFGRKKLARR
jgi:hypothetical protein